MARNPRPVVKSADPCPDPIAAWLSEVDDPDHTVRVLHRANRKNYVELVTLTASSMDPGILAESVEAHGSCFYRAEHVDADGKVLDAITWYYGRDTASTPVQPVPCCPTCHRPFPDPTIMVLVDALRQSHADNGAMRRDLSEILGSTSGLVRATAEGVQGFTADLFTAGRRSLRSAAAPAPEPVDAKTQALGTLNALFEVFRPAASTTAGASPLASLRGEILAAVGDARVRSLAKTIDAVADLYLAEDDGDVAAALKCLELEQATLIPALSPGERVKLLPLVERAKSAVSDYESRAGTVDVSYADAPDEPGEEGSV